MNMTFAADIALNLHYSLWKINEIYSIDVYNMEHSFIKKDCILVLAVINIALDLRYTF